MYLWSNPDLPHWQRLLLGVVYLPILFWWWLVGNPIQLSRRTPYALDGATGAAKEQARRNEFLRKYFPSIYPPRK